MTRPNHASPTIELTKSTPFSLNEHTMRSTFIPLFPVITLVQLVPATPARGILDLVLGGGETHSQQLPSDSLPPTGGLPQQPIGCGNSGGTVQCCNTVQHADAISESDSLLGSLLSFAGLSGNGLVGITCNPVGIAFS
jgi:hypothetical protein